MVNHPNRSRSAKMCQYGDCLVTCENGVALTLRTATYEGDTKAEFCCVSHAAAALAKLAEDRKETVPPLPRWWKSA